MNAWRHYSKFVALFVVLGALILSFTLVQAQDDAAAEEAQRTALTRLGTEWLVQGDNSVLEEFTADDYIVHSPVGDLNREGVIALFDAMRAALTDMEATRDIVVEGNTAVTHGAVTGTFTNEFNSPFGVYPPTGQPFYWETINIFHFNEEGKIQEEWVQFDTAALFAQLAPTPAAAESTGVLSEEAAAHFVERLTALFDGPNLDIADEIFAPDTVNHLPLAPNLDLEAWKAYVASFYVGIPDLKDHVNQIIIAPDRLILHSTYSGTHDGVLFGVPATGNPVSLDGITIFRFNEAGLVVEAWSIIDVVGLLAQIGAFPPAPAE